MVTDPITVATTGLWDVSYFVSSVIRGEPLSESCAWSQRRRRDERGRKPDDTGFRLSCTIPCSLARDVVK